MSKKTDKKRNLKLGIIASCIAVGAMVGIIFTRLHKSMKRQIMPN